MNRILTANENILIVHNGGNYRGWIERETARRCNVYPNWHLNKALPPVLAFVETSTWVWMCDNCNHLWWAEPTFPRAFCPDCLNEKYGGFSRLIVFPKDKKAIERQLKARIDPKTRNWQAHETIEDLIAENIQHGV